jgi:hypothetical protein
LSGKGMRLFLDFPEKGKSYGFISEFLHRRRPLLCLLILGDLSEERESFLGILLVELRNGKPRMDNHPVPDPDVLEKRKIDPDFGPEIVHSALSGVIDLGDFSRNP